MGWFGEDFTPRYALQLMGTEVGRDVFNKNFWVIKLKQYIESNPDQHFVITDVRFANEIDFVHQNDGVLIEIERGVKPHWYDIAAKAYRGDSHAIDWMKTESGVHESEWNWVGGKIDHFVQNSGTMEDLKTNLVQCLIKTYGADTISKLKKGIS